MVLTSTFKGHPPSVSVKKPVPEIICHINEDEDKIRDNIRKNMHILPIRKIMEAWNHL